jgi:hypothetical protein
VNLPPKQLRKAGALEAFINGLVGGVDRVTLHRLDRPKPTGTLRGSPVLAVDMAQFSDMMQLAEAWDTSKKNLYPWSDNLVNWRSYGENTTITPDAATGLDGAASADYLRETADDGSHFIDRYEPYADGPGAYSLAADVKAVERDGVILAAYSSGNNHGAWFNLTSRTITNLSSGDTASIESVGDGWYRCTLRISNVSNVTGPIQRIYVWDAAGATGSSYPGVAGSGILVGGLQLQPGAPTDRVRTTGAPRFAAGSVKAGDMLGVGSQLFQVRFDAAADDAGLMTVQTVNRTRSTLLAGTAVVWNKPTATFMVQDTASSFNFMPGSMSASSFRLIEVP